MSKSIILGGVKYPTLKQAKAEFIQPLYDKYGDKRKWPWRVTDHEDEQKLLELFWYCVLFQDFWGNFEKIQNGDFSHFEVNDNLRGGGKHCFWIVDTDGNRSDWRCFKPTDGAITKRAEVSAAFRRAVQLDIFKFKKSQRIPGNMVRCHVTGDIVPIKDADVHHAGKGTFADIFTAFLAHIQIDPAGIALTKDDMELESLDLREDFRAFHNERAQLQVVSRSVHHTL